FRVDVRAASAGEMATTLATRTKPVRSCPLKLEAPAGHNFRGGFAFALFAMAWRDALISIENCVLGLRKTPLYPSALPGHNRSLPVWAPAFILQSTSHHRVRPSRAIPDRARQATGTTHWRLTTTSPCTELIHSDDPRWPPLSRYPSCVLRLTKSGGTDLM